MNSPSEVNFSMPPPWPARLRAWLGEWDNAVFVLLILVYLAPIWAFTYVPTQDGPAHVCNAHILRAYGEPESTAYREYYALNTRLNANWFGHLLMAGLMYLVPVLVAEKLVLTAYVILLPVAIRYAVCVVRPDARFLAVLGFPFIYSYPMLMGFYNFVFSLPLFFFLIGYWLKRGQRFAWRPAAALAAISVVLFFSHMVSLVLGCAAIGLMAVWLSWLDWAQGRATAGAVWRGFLSRMAGPAVAMLLPAGLMLAFLQKQPFVAAKPNWLSGMLKGLVKLDALIAFYPGEAALTTALAGLFVLTVVYAICAGRRRPLCAGDGFLLVTTACLVLYFVVPNKFSAGAYMNSRLNLYPFFALILWFAAQSFTVWSKWIIRVAGGLLAVGMAAMRLAQFAEANDYLSEYCSSKHLIEPNTTLLPLSFANAGRWPDGSTRYWRLGIFMHAAGYLAAERRAVNLVNYECNYGNFPVLYRERLNPYLHIGAEPGIESDLPDVNFLTYPQRTGGRVDYVLLWWWQEKLRTHPSAQAILRQLDAGYDLIYTSPQRGLMRLYRRKGFQSGRPPLPSLPSRGP